MTLVLELKPDLEERLRVLDEDRLSYRRFFPESVHNGRPGT